MPSTPITIGSIEELRQQVPAILKRLNADQALLLAAAANPVFALEELGYRIPNELLRDLDRRIRFSPAERERLDALTVRLQEIAKVAFDPEDPAELERVLFARLALPELPPPPVRVAIPEASPLDDRGRKASTSDPHVAATTPARPVAAAPVIPLHRLAVRYHAAATGAEPDVLHMLPGKHPILAPLLEYRAILARHAPFAPRAVYDRLRKGTTGGVSLTLRARLHRKEG